MSRLKWFLFGAALVGVIVMILWVLELRGFQFEKLREMLGSRPVIYGVGIAAIVGEGLGLAGLALGKMRSGARSVKSMLRRSRPRTPTSNAD